MIIKDRTYHIWKELGVTLIGITITWLIIVDQEDYIARSRIEFAKHQTESRTFNLVKIGK